jgi:hypothetical protein
MPTGKDNFLAADPSRWGEEFVIAGPYDRLPASGFVYLYGK